MITPVVEGLALAALPLTARVFRALPDRGYAFSKVVGLLLVGFVIVAPNGIIGLFQKFVQHKEPEVTVRKRVKVEVP